MHDQLFLTREIIDLAVAAPGLPEGTLGWTLESAKHALEKLGATKIAVVEIDAYDRVAWGFAPAGESWTCEHVRGESASDFALRSRRESLEWLNSFPRSEVLFAIQFSNQDIAATSSGLG